MTLVQRGHCAAAGAPIALARWFRASRRRAIQKVRGVHCSLGQRGSVMLSCLHQIVVEFVKREDGPTAVEYAVMLALIIVVCIGAITMIGQSASSTFTSVGNAIGSGS